MLRTRLIKHLSEIEGTRTHERGVTYAHEGRVRALDESDGVSATVRGTRQYRTWLWEEDRRLRHECSCPVGREGDFCKHCVALGIVWLDVGHTKGRRRSKSDIRREERRLSTIVGSLTQEELAKLVLHAAKQDRALRERLLLVSTAEVDRKRAVEEWKRSFEKVVDPGGYVTWDEMPAFADGIERVLDELLEWISFGRAEEVVLLSEWAVDMIGDIVGFCDDDGDLNRIFSHLSEMHLMACEAWKPDPNVLADRLAKLERSDEWGVFSDAGKRYARLIGRTGKSHARKQMPRIKPHG